MARTLDVHEQLAADVLAKATDHVLMAQGPAASAADKRANVYEAIKYLEIAEKALAAQENVNQRVQYAA